MAEQLPCFQPGFDFLNVENSDHIYFIKEIKLVARASLSYKSTQEFKNTREVREALAFGSCFSALLSC